MSRKEVIVHFETITPLWTGDAWQENSRVRPSALMGSLRFWFEILCYFSGIIKKSDFDSKRGKFEKEINYEKLKKILLDCGGNLEEAAYIIAELGIPLSAVIFGTTSWKSLIEIKWIGNCHFRDGIGLDDRICVSKNGNEIKEGSNCPIRSNKEWSVFYFPNSSHFFGEFQVIFSVEDFILEEIFYPLLTFMDEYGYWGGKWNIGYGRLRVKTLEQANWRKNEFKFEKFNKENKKIQDLVVRTKLTDASRNDSFDELVKLNDNKKIKIIIDEKSRSADLKWVIKGLISTKAKARARCRNNEEERHKIFGTNKKPPRDDIPQGSKVLPYIKKENENYVSGFLSIVNLLSLYNKGD